MVEPKLLTAANGSALKLRSIMNLYKEGFYVGPAGQVVEIYWEQSRGPNTFGDFCYSVDGCSYKELSNEIRTLLEGFEYLGELEQSEPDWGCY
jgi:hypothetical protein